MRSIFSGIVAVACIWAPTSHASLESRTNVSLLSFVADEIIVGSVSHVHSFGTPVDGSETFDIYPLRVIKGTVLVGSSIHVNLKLSDYSPYVKNGEFGIAFLHLTANTGSYDVLGQNSPLIVASPQTEAFSEASKTPNEKVATELAQVFEIPLAAAANPQSGLERPGPSMGRGKRGEKVYSQACDALKSFPQQITLKVIADYPDITTIGHRWASICRLSFGDSGQLNRLEPFLLKPDVDDDLAVANATVAMVRSNFKGQDVLALGDLLKSDDVSVRRASVYALRHIRDPSIITPLIQALDDPDLDVRTNAVFALCQVSKACAGTLVDYYAQAENINQFSALIKHALVPQ